MTSHYVIPVFTDYLTENVVSISQATICDPCCNWLANRDLTLVVL